MSRTHNELSQVTVTASPLDTTGTAYTPTTARYKVTDCRSEDVIVAWTTLTPATSMQIVIPGSVNTIKDDTRTTEDKVVTVNTDKDLTTQHYQEYQYRIKNLKFVKAGLL